MPDFRLGKDASAVLGADDQMPVFVAERKTDAPQPPDAKEEYRLMPRDDSEWISPHQWFKKYGNDKWKEYDKLWQAPGESYNDPKWDEDIRNSPEFDWDELRKMAPWMTWKQWKKLQDKLDEAENRPPYDEWLVEQLQKGNKKATREDYAKMYPQDPRDMTEEQEEEVRKRLKPEDRKRLEYMEKYPPGAFDHRRLYFLRREGHLKFLREHPEILKKFLGEDEANPFAPKSMEEWIGW